MCLKKFCTFVTDTMLYPTQLVTRQQLRLFLITGCAQHCCNDYEQSHGKTGILTPCRSDMSENFITKIGHFVF